MKNLENIDEFFSDKLNQHEENVPPYVWDNIADKLNKKQKRKRLFYMQSAAASVAILIAFFAGYYLTNVDTSTQFASDQNSQIQEVTTINNSSNEDGSAKSINFISDDGTIINEKTETIDGKEQIEKNNALQDVDLQNFKNKNVKNNNNVYLAIAKEEEQKVERNFIQRIFNIDFTEIELEKESREIVYPDNIQIAFADVYGINNEEDIEEESIKRWLVGGSLSPVYSYRNTSSPNSYESADYGNGNKMPNSNEGGVMAYAGGVNVGYKLNKRLNVYSGVIYSEVGQVSNDVYINEYQSSATQPLEINTSMGDIRTNYSSYNLVNSVTDEFSAPMDMLGENTYASNTINSKVYQYIEFLEVPVLLKYKLIDRRLGMHLLGGMSTSFVVGNESLLEYESTKYDLGETDNIQKVNYNSTFGVGIEYALSESLSMSLEPTFKYALNSINTSYKVYPYSIAVFTGLNYRF
jgi:hypothetical protein